MLTKAQKKKREEFRKKLKLIVKILAVVVFVILGFVFLYDHNTDEDGQKKTFYSLKKSEETLTVTPTRVIPEKVSPERVIIGETEIRSKDPEVSKEQKVQEKEPVSPTAVSDPEGRININTAGVNELTKLNGIGEKRARDIIDYRDTYGGFSKIEDIMKVKGIKQGIFSKIKDEIYCG